MKGLWQSPTLRLVLVLLLWFPVALPIVGWSYTSVQLTRASARGVYDSAEEGMRSRLQEQYEGTERITWAFSCWPFWSRRCSPSG
jgi:hypothetical protein